MKPRVGSKIFHMTAVATVVAVGLAAAGAPASATVKSGAAPRAKISMNQARAIALKTFDGTIVKAELEQERGAAACAIRSTCAAARPGTKSALTP